MHPLIGKGEMPCAFRHHAQGDRRLTHDPAAECGGDRRGCREFVASTVGGEVARITAKDVVCIELIGLAAEAADRLQPIDKLRVGLRPRSLESAAVFCRGQLLERGDHKRV